MTTACHQLETAVFQALLAHTELITLLGSAKIYDHVPERVRFPYVVLGRCSTADWSTATEDGQSITFFVHVWSKSTGKAEVFALQESIRSALASLTGTLGTYTLANLRFQLAETRRDRVSRHLHGLLRFRATVEPNAQ